MLKEQTQSKFAILGGFYGHESSHLAKKETRNTVRINSITSSDVNTECHCNLVYYIYALTVGQSWNDGLKEFLAIRRAISLNETFVLFC